MSSANNFINLLRDMIREELNKRDSTSVCVIDSVNPDGTLNIYILPDRSTLFKNILNASKYTFAAGEVGVLYKIRNQINNSFVIAKYKP